jgi:phage gp36-like protein
VTNWVTNQSMIDAFGAKEILQLTDRDLPRTGQVVASVLEAAIVEAQGVVSPILRRRYPQWPTPLIPEGVKSKVRHITRYYLQDPNATELVRQNYEDALAWLDKAVFTNEELGITPPDGEAASSAASSDAVGVARISKYGSAFAGQYDPCSP